MTSSTIWSVALGIEQLYERKRESRLLEAATHSLTKSVDLIRDISDLEQLRTPTGAEHGEGPGGH